MLSPTQGFLGPSPYWGSAGVDRSPILSRALQGRLASLGLCVQPPSTTSWLVVGKLGSVQVEVLTLVRGTVVNFQ